MLRVDVVTGAILTGVIGFFVVVACAATLHQRGIHISDASDAAAALEPLAGHLASELFAVGLIGAALLAASILPLSTGYAVSDFLGRPAALDDSVRNAPLFYGTFAFVTVTAVVILLLPLLAYMYGISRDRELMGRYTARREVAAVYLVVIVLISICIGALGYLSIG